MKSAASFPFRLFVAASALFVTVSAWGQDQAFTNRSTELKDKGAAEARTIETLPDNTAVKVLARAGGWTQVDAGGKAGWVRAFHLRFPVAVEKSSSGNPLSGLSSMFGGSNRQQQANTGTVGVRGLSPEDLKGASPNNEALAKANSYRSDKPTAERYAREGKLENTKVDYSGGGR